MPAAELLAAGTGLLEIRRGTLYGPSREDTSPQDEMTLHTDYVVEAGRSHIIERPRLTSLLDRATAPIIMLVAPAGFGKTTLARQWLAHRRHGWYRGSPAAADVAALAVGLARTASALVPDAGRRMGERLRATGTPEQDVEPLAELLAEDLAEWPEDAWLAFDDYQFACESPFAEHFVERVLALCPLRLFLATRTRPAWATSKRLLYGEIYELGKSLLAMNQDEAELVLAHRRGSEAGGLVALADGWPAVIGLAALAEDFDLPEGGVPDTLYAYFAEELYQAIEPELQRSICQLALSSAVAADMARSFLGEQSERVLSEGLRVGLLISSSPRIYEIHPLLRGFLEQKFRESPSDHAATTIERLVKMHLAREEWDEVFSLVERFFNQDLLVELFEAALPFMLVEARLPTLGRWVDYAVSRAVDAAAVNLAEGELAFRSGDQLRAEALAMQAARRLGENHHLTSRALCLAGSSAHLNWRDETALEHFARAHDTAQSRQDAQQALWGRFLATVALERETEAGLAFSDFDAGEDYGPDGVLRRANGQLFLATLQGDVRRALDLAKATLPLAPRSTDPMVQSSFLHVYASTLALAARYEEADHVAIRELEFSERTRLAFVAPHAHLSRAAALCGLRKFRECLALLSQAERLSPTDDFLAMNVGTVLARVYLALGSTGRAMAALETHQRASSTPGMDAEYEAWWGLVLACADRTSEALERAAAAKEATARVEVRGLAPWTSAVVALKVRASDSRERIERAFEVAHGSGNLDGFVAAYRGCPELLKRLTAERENHQRLRPILFRAQDFSLARAAGLHLSPPRSQIGRSRLSRREREVLDMLAQGLTNRELASALFLSEATVKVHLRHIYEKLGVRTRTEAVVRALEGA